MSRFLTELKRRRVVRVALVYAAVTFAVVQAADLMLPRLGLPDWTVTFIVVLALLGFPVALALSWAFEMTPEGLRRTESATGDATVVQSRWLSPRTVASAAAVLLVTAAGAWYAGRNAAPGPPPADRGSIAVLPFVNMGDRAEDEYFSDGLAEELLNLLARVEGLQVAARTSAFAFKGINADVRAIGDSLGVATVLEGGVRRDGENVRVTAQLIDVASGYHLWSDSYDAELSGLFAVQERIARAIVDALEIELGTGAALAAGPAPTVAAHDLYLLGLARFHARGTAAFEERSPVHDAIGYFERAVAADSTYAQAWAGLAIAHVVLPGFDATAPSLEHGPKARAAATRAIALDDRLAEPYAALCVVYGNVEYRWAEAERACDTAVERNPNSALAHHWRAELYASHGRFAEAEAGLQRALALDPLSTIARMQAAIVPMNAGDLDEAERRLQALLPMEGTGAAAGLLFMIHVLQADTSALEAHIRPLEPGAPNAAQLARMFISARSDPAARAQALAVAMGDSGAATLPNPLAQALFLAGLGEDEGALRQLQRAREIRTLNLPNYYGNPAFARLRDDPRFLEIGRTMGLVPPPWEGK